MKIWRVVRKGGKDRRDLQEPRRGTSQFKLGGSPAEAEQKKGGEDRIEQVGEELIGPRSGRKSARSLPVI